MDELRAQLAKVRAESAHTQLVVKGLVQQAAQAEEEHRLRQELHLAQLDLARHRTRLAHYQSLCEVLGCSADERGAKHNVFYIGEGADEAEDPAGDPHALHLLVAVLLRARPSPRPSSGASLG